MQKVSVANHIFQSVKPFKKYIFLHIFVVVFNAIDTSLWPFISKLLIDKITTLEKGEIFTNIWPIATIFILLTIVPGLIWRIADYSWAYLNPLIKKKIMLEAGSKMLEKSQNFYQNNQAGACANRIKELANNTPKLFDMILYNFFGIFLSLIFAFCAMLYVHKFFAISLIIWALIFILMAIRSAKLTDEMSAKIALQQAKIMGNVVDVFGNIQNVKFFTNQQKEREKFAYLQNRYAVFFKSRSFFLLKFYTLHGLTFSLYFCASIIALIYFYSENKVTIGDFTLVFTINCWMINAMWNAANQMQGFLEEYGAVKQALKMIQRPLEVQDKKNASILKLKSRKGAEIIFDKVKFSYRLLAQPSTEFKPVESMIFGEINNKNNIFAHKEDLNLEEKLIIKRGEKIGLVGHSGSGKSTFVNLLMRSYDINSGKILVDNQDIKEVTQNSLRQAITIIPQDPLLFHRTLYENIAYAKNNAKDQEIFEASKKAYCNKFIENLPKKYETLVGDRGVKLSGGQRQRIAIARAFLEDAPILIMDEGTSQLDSITENLIQRSFDKLIKNKTAIIIAHRLSTLKNVDRILVFDSGKIVEQGNHQELLAKKGLYFKMYQEQIGGFLN